MCLFLTTGQVRWTLEPDARHVEGDRRPRGRPLPRRTAQRQRQDPRGEHGEDWAGIAVALLCALLVLCKVQYCTGQCRVSAATLRRLDVCISDVCVRSSRHYPLTTDAVAAHCILIGPFFSLALIGTVTDTDASTVLSV